MDGLVQRHYSSSRMTASSEWAPRLEELLTKNRHVPVLCLHLKCVSIHTKELLKTHQVNSLQYSGWVSCCRSRWRLTRSVPVCACTVALLFWPKEMRSFLAQYGPHLILTHLVQENKTNGELRLTPLIRFVSCCFQL